MFRFEILTIHLFHFIFFAIFSLKIFLYLHILIEHHQLYSVYLSYCCLLNFIFFICFFNNVLNVLVRIIGKIFSHILGMHLMTLHDKHHLRFYCTIKFAIETILAQFLNQNLFFSSKEILVKSSFLLFFFYFLSL